MKRLSELIILKLDLIAGGLLAIKRGKCLKKGGLALITCNIWKFKLLCLKESLFLLCKLFVNVLAAR